MPTEEKTGGRTRCYVLWPIFVGEIIRNRKIPYPDKSGVRGPLGFAGGPPRFDRAHANPQASRHPAIPRSRRVYRRGISEWPARSPVRNDPRRQRAQETFTRAVDGCRG